MKPLWQVEGFTSQSSYHRAMKRKRGICQQHGCQNPVRVKIVNGKVVRTYTSCLKHATRKSRGFE